MPHESGSVYTFKTCFVIVHHYASTLFQEQRENHKRAITALSEQLKNTLKELREKAKERKEAELGWKKENKERAFEEGKLRDNLQKRDKLIEVGLVLLEMTGCHLTCDLMMFVVIPFSS